MKIEYEYITFPLKKSWMELYIDQDEFIQTVHDAAQRGFELVCVVPRVIAKKSYRSELRELLLVFKKSH